MDILIKNMEMPKDNKRIFLCIEKDGEVGVFEEKKLIRFTEAQELPPHGRLIDGDELWSKFRQANKDCYQIGKYERASQWYDAEGFVEMQKTIVEANNGTDN